MVALVCPSPQARHPRLQPLTYFLAKLICRFHWTECNHGFQTQVSNERHCTLPPSETSASSQLTLQPSLVETAEKLALNPPAKYEPANRRVRALLNGKWLFDTLKALYVWEHPYCTSHVRPRATRVMSTV